MTRTSTAPAISSRAHSHAVPAARFASPASAFGHLRVGAGLDDALVQTAVAGVRLLDPADFDRRTVGRLAHAGEQVGDHLVAVGGHPDPLPAGEQIEDHPRAGVGLAAAWRPLHGNRAVEPRGDPLDGGQRGLAPQGEAFPPAEA